EYPAMAFTVWLPQVLSYERIRLVVIFCIRCDPLVDRFSRSPEPGIALRFSFIRLSYNCVPTIPRNVSPSAILYSAFNMPDKSSFALFRCPPCSKRAKELELLPLG